VVLLSAIVVVAGLFIGSAAAGDVGTIAVNPMRTAWDSNEPALTPSSVGSSTFGQLFSTAVDGQVYAQPLVVGGTVVAATENNAVYALDGSGGSVKWQRSLGPAWPASTVSCPDVAPNVGVTSTPVYDPATNSVFLMAKTNDGASPQLPHWYMHSLDITTGAERAGFPVLIDGAPTNDPTRPFNAMTQMQRPALLLLAGVVYAAFGGHCDYSPYVGYVVGVSTSGHQTTMWATESGTSNAGGGIWQSGGGLASDGPGQILFTSGNGIAPPPGPGSAPPTTLAESVVRLNVGSDGNLTATDFFSPANNARLNTDDADLGSGSPLAIPDGYGTTAHPHLATQVGKAGQVYLLDRDHLGGMAQGTGGTDAVLDKAGPYNGVWGRQAFLGTSQGGYLYQVENSGYLRAFRVVPGSTGGVSLAAVGTSSGTFGFSSGSPVVTSTGTDGSSALVWVVYTANGTGSSAELRAYRAIPDSTGVLQQVFAAPIGTAAKFSSPATDGGHVYVGTRDGHVYGFGSPTHAAVGATGTDLGQAQVGAVGGGTVTVTAARPVTITAITAAAPFGISPAPALPVTLPAGGTLAVPVTFSPTVAGQANGNLSVTTSDGETDLLGVHAIGTKDGLGATPAAMTFTDVPTQSISRHTVNIVNTGTTVVTVTGVTQPVTSSLTVDPSTLPAVGQQIQPLASVPVSVSYSPTTTAAVSDSLVVTSNLGGVTVPITATAVSGASHLQLPASLDFGDVPVGMSSTRSFQIQNTGNIPLTITKAKAPLGVFSTATPLAEGLVLPAGQSVYQSVTFTPTVAGQAGTTGTYYLITSDDGQGALEVMLTGNGVDDPIAVKAQQVGGGNLWSALGVATSAEYNVGAGKCQDYQRGVICWSPATGAHEVHGGIYLQYAAAGGAGGFLGFPRTDEQGTSDGVGRFNDFAGASGSSIYWSPATGAHEVHGGIRASWLSAGGAVGFLGYPTTNEQGTSDGVGRFNDFAGSSGSSIYWTPSTGAHEVHGGIRASWLSAGGAQGFLGYPTTDELGTGDGVGRFNDFSGSSGSSIYWAPSSGGHEVHGGIRAKWLQLGGALGFMGYPTTDELGTADGVGRFNHFTGSSGSSIFWSPSTGAHEVHGGIRAQWAAMNWERGPLGYPISDEYAVPGGRESDFQRGRLIWYPWSGVVVG
jgi:hypothetical protein